MINIFKKIYKIVFILLNLININNNKKKLKLKLIKYNKML